MDIQLEPSVQRKGLGRHLMRTLEMIARKQVQSTQLHRPSATKLCNRILFRYVDHSVSTQPDSVNSTSRDNIQPVAAGDVAHHDARRGQK